MARLFRPPIPLEVKCRVLLRQLGEMFPNAVITARPRGLGRLHALLMRQLADALMCLPEDLRLDHDPALALRERTGEGKSTVYTPAANDPEYLAYRPHGAEHDGSHDVKTRIRGDHGQFSDITLIKRERRRQKKAAAAKDLKKNPSKWRSVGFAKSKKKMKAGETRWPKRSFPKRRK